MKSYEDYKKEADEVFKAKKLYHESERDSWLKHQKSLADEKLIKCIFRGILGGAIGLIIGWIVALILIIPVYLAGSLLDNFFLGFKDAQLNDYPIAHSLSVIIFILCTLYGAFIGAREFTSKYR